MFIDKEICADSDENYEKRRQDFRRFAREGNCSLRQGKLMKKKNFPPCL